MTRDEQREAAWQEYFKSIKDHPHGPMPRTAFDAGYTAGSEGRWIPIRSVDDLPKIAGDYAITTGTGMVTTSYFCPCGNGHWSYAGIVIAWMRKPPAYKED